MGLLSELAATVMGGQSAPQQQNLLASVAELLNHPQVGGIGGLAKLFENQGLGHLVSGWVGNGPNPPVSPSQLQQVLGSERIAEVAKKLGVDPNQAATQLAAILPHAVDQLTPNGAMPAAGSSTAMSMLEELKSKLMSA